MALQNLMGDLALESTQISQNDLINTLTDLIAVMRLQISQQNNFQPRMTATNHMYVDISGSLTNGNPIRIQHQDTLGGHAMGVSISRAWESYDLSATAAMQLYQKIQVI